MFDRRLQKGVYFVPTLLTMGNILCGFFAIIASFDENWVAAGIAIGIAFILDGLDGRIARLADAESEFGLQLDSLADLVTFGVAPAVLAYTNWLHVYDRLGILLAFLYVCGAAMRLARFNAHDVKEDSIDYFNGFPTPSAAGVVVSIYFLEYKLYLTGDLMTDEIHRIYVLLVPLALLTLSYLMLSNIRYPTFKKVTWLEEHPFGVLFILLCFVFVAALYPFGVFIAFFLCYLMTGCLDVCRIAQSVVREKILG